MVCGPALAHHSVFVESANTLIKLNLKQSNMAYYRRYQNYTPVAKFISPNDIANFCTKEEGEQLIQFLEKYDGDFQPMIDTKKRFMSQQGYKYSGLSEKQWSMVRNTMQRASKPKLETFTAIQFNPPIDITVNKGAAFNHFKKKLGMKYGIFTLRVHEVVEATPSRGGGYYKLKMKVSPNADGTVSACRVCGKALTDHTSITTGIGPTCAKKIGAMKAYKSDVKKFMEEVKKEFAKVGITEMETWHSNIVENVQPILDAIEQQKTAPVAMIPEKPIATIYTKDIEWLPTDRSFVVNRTMGTKSEMINILYKLLKSNLDSYINIMNPKTTKWVKFEFSHSENHADYFKPMDPNCETIDYLIIKK
jgi:Family of unknown function (DUF6011)